MPTASSSRPQSRDPFLRVEVDSHLGKHCVSDSVRNDVNDLEWVPGQARDDEAGCLRQLCDVDAPNVGRRMAIWTRDPAANESEPDDRCPNRLPVQINPSVQVTISPEIWSKALLRAAT